MSMSLPTLPASPLANIQILIAEDDDTIRSLLCDLLELEGAEVTAACSGNEALTILRTFRPQLIISDVMMADGDGHELLHSVQADPALNGIPFIFLTARSEPSEFRRSMNLGADDYLIKPVSRTDLVHAVRTRLLRSRVAGHCQRKQLDQFRDELARSVPHELLTPLQTISGATEVLATDPSLSTDARELIDMVLLGCDRMTRTVKRFWRWSELQLELQNLPAGAVARSATANTCSARICEISWQVCAAAHRGGDLELRVAAARLPLSDDHLVLIVQELLDNALKFSKPGMRIQVTLEQNATGGTRLLVADSGVGMTPEQIASVGPLRQFQRRAREQQGPGLGLAMVTTLARLNGLPLAFESTGSGGLAVILTFPN
jgi:two-component system, sensor histidine kinase and response regulator